MIKADFLKAQKNELPFHYDYPYEDSDFLFWTFQCIKQKDGDFRDLWRELRACPSPTEKAEMVKNRSKSVTDFLDLMEAGRFFGEGCPARRHNIATLSAQISF